MIPVGKAESPDGARELLDDKNEKIGVVADLIISIEGVRLAQKGGTDGIHEECFAPLRELMDNFTKAGGTIYVCSPCYKKRKLDEHNLVAGASIVGGAKLVEFLADGKSVRELLNERTRSRAAHAPVVLARPGQPPPGLIGRSWPSRGWEPGPRLRRRPSSGANDRRPTHDPSASSPSGPAPILGRSEARSNVRVPRCTSACSAARCTRPVSTRSWPKAAAASSRWVRGAEREEPGQPDRDWLRNRPTAPGKRPKRRTLGMSSPLWSPPPDASPSSQLNTPNNHSTTSKLSGTPKSHSRNALPMISPPGRGHCRPSRSLRISRSSAL
jgi:predicted peroxiredoxin